MSYESTVYRILIASPSDVEEEREIVARIIQDWNDLNSFNKKIVLLPIRWETHSSPSYGIRPQEAINKQIVDECDMLIGFFWTKIGTPTGEEISGTIEEIKRVSKAGKPVMLYFSKRGKDPSEINLKQLELLNNFKSEIYSTALVENYSSIVNFRDKLSKHLEMKIRELQERKDSSEDLISFSLIDKSKGILKNKKTEVEIERIKVNKSKLLNFRKENKKLASSFQFNNALKKYINRKNNIPVVLGLQNNSNRILGNINIELRLKCSKENSLKVQSYGNSDESYLPSRFDEVLSLETESQIKKLFSDNLVQTSEKIWEFKLNPFTLLPKKLKVIDSLILLFPTNSVDIEFSIQLFSENILQTISSSCHLKINFKERELSKEELSEILENATEELPF